MALSDRLDLPVVDGLALPATVRTLLKPGEAIRDREGESHVLPRFFYEIESPSAALTQLTPHFVLAEFIEVDLHEAAPLRDCMPAGVA